MRSTVVQKALLTAASALLMGSMLGNTASGATEGVGAIVDAAGSAERAVVLLEEGKPVAARAMLRQLVDDAPAADRVELLGLLERADAAMRALTPAELRVHRAELLIQNGDLRAAEAQLEAARQDAETPIAVRAQASELLDEIARQRLEFYPLVDSVLRQAVSDFRSERYAEAKAGFVSLDRSGVKMERDEARTVEIHLERIDRLERDRGVRFDAPEVSLGVLAQAADGAAAAGMAQPADDGMGGDDAQEAEAERLFAEANAAFEEGRYVAADQLYSEVLRMPLARYLSVDQIETGLAHQREAQRLGGIQSDLDPVEGRIQMMELVRGQYEAEVRTLVRRAEEALDRGDPEAARTRLAEARLTWNTGVAGGFFSEDENRAQQEVFDRLRQRIDSAAEQIASRERAQAEIDRRDREQELRQQAEAERREAINDFLDQLRALQEEQQYEDALQVVDQILFLDPNNQPALMMKRVLEDILIYREAMELRRDRDLSIAVEMNAMLEATRFDDAILSFPEDWPQLSETRLLYSDADDFTESPRDRAVIARLESVTMPANFDGVELENVVEFVASVTNLNVDVDWDALELIGIDRETEVELDLTSEIPASTLLDRVMQKISPDEFERAGWAVQDGIVLVSSEAELRKNTFIVIYDVRDLIFEIPDFDAVPSLDLDSILGGDGGGGQSPFEDDDEDDEDSPLGIGQEELDNLDDLLDIIRQNIDPDGWRANGGETGTVQPFQQYLVITNTAKNHRQIRDLLRQLREIRNIQITVESRFITVAQNFFEQIGFDVDVFLNTEDEDRSDAIARQPGPQAAFGAFPNQGRFLDPRINDLPQGSVQADNAWVLVDDGQGNLVPSLQPVPYFVPYQSSGFGEVPVEQNSLGLANTLFAGSEFATGILNNNPALSIAGTFFDDIQVDFLIQATQADRRSVLLQAPRLTFTNGKVANIIVSTQTAFVADLEPIVGTSAVAFDPDPATVPDGFTLLVGGVVSADRRFVTLALEIGFTTLVGLESFPVPVAVGGAEGSDGGGIAEGQIQLPIQSVTRIQTGVTIPDRGTILLGGQRIGTEVEIETGVPVLSKIPVLNRFFTNRITETEEETLIVLMKPTIVIQGEEEERNFPGLQDRLNPLGF